MRRNALFSLPLISALACASAQPAPTAEADILRTDQVVVTDQSLTDFTAEARLELPNNSDAPMHVGKANWQLSLDNKVIASGATDIDKTAEAGQTLQFRVPATAEIVKNEDDLKALMAHGSEPMELLMRGTVKITQGAKTEEHPFSHTGELRAPRAPVPKMDDADLGRSDEDVTVSFYVGIDNQNPFRIHMKSLKYKAEIDGQVVGEGVANMGDDLPPSQTSEFPVQENVATLDRTKTSVPYHFTGTAEFGLMQVPIDLSGNLTFSNKAAKPVKAKKKKKSSE